MKKDTVLINEKVVGEHLKPVFNFALFCFIAAVVFFALMIVFSILNNNWLEVSTIIFAIVGALCLFAGLFAIINYVKGINIAKTHASKMDYEFFDDHLSYVTSRDDRVIQQGDIPYQNLAGYKETKNYVFLAIKDNSFLAFNKSEDILSFVKEKGLVRIKTVQASRKK